MRTPLSKRNKIKVEGIEKISDHGEVHKTSTHDCINSLFQFTEVTFWNWRFRSVVLRNLKLKFFRFLLNFEVSLKMFESVDLNENLKTFGEAISVKDDINMKTRLNTNSVVRFDYKSISHFLKQLKGLASEWKWVFFLETKFFGRNFWQKTQIYKNSCVTKT